MNLKKKDVVYYARIIPNTGIYEVCELIIRTVADDYFAGYGQKRQAYLLVWLQFNRRHSIRRQKRCIKQSENCGE